MRTSALEYLACPRTGAALVADAEATAPDGHLMSGMLVAASGARYPIVDGVPRFSAQQSANSTAAHADNPLARRQLEQRFLESIAPLAPHDLVDRVILDASCPGGHHSAILASYGARAVLTFADGPAAVKAFAATRHLPAVHVVSATLDAPPLARASDFALIGPRLAELADPAAGVRALYDRVRVGGRITLRVPSLEGNQWLVRWLDPIRRLVTSRLPPELVRLAALPPALALAAGLYPYRYAAVARHLPLGDRLGVLSGDTLTTLHQALVAHLMTPVLHFASEGAVRSWLGSADFTDAAFARHNQSAWRAIATVVGHAFSGAIAKTDVPAAAARLQHP